VASDVVVVVAVATEVAVFELEEPNGQKATSSEK
jgi:hypothetical protein